MSDATALAGGSAASQTAREGRRGGAKPFVALLVVLMLAYLASPYVSFWFFTRAIKANDREALESYVDFPSVRQSLKHELRGKLPKSSASEPGKKEDVFSGMAARLAPTLIDQLVDAFVTPDGLAALISDPAVARQAKAKDPTALAHMQNESKDKELNWSRVKYAFFNGVTQFLVEIEGTKLHFGISGMRWRLQTVQLPPNE